MQCVLCVRTTILAQKGTGVKKSVTPSTNARRQVEIDVKLCHILYAERIDHPPSGAPIRRGLSQAPIPVLRRAEDQPYAGDNRVNDQVQGSRASPTVTLSDNSTNSPEGDQGQKSSQGGIHYRMF